MIEFLSECSSTQTELIYLLKKELVKPPYALLANSQTSGVGSRENSWQSDAGNFYFSFSIYEKDIPNDVPPQSLSIYFAYLMKLFLESKGSNLWLKWPNDFYLNDKKIGGVITNKIKDIYICGMGINLTTAPDGADTLDIDICPKKLAEGFAKILEQEISWKQIFSKFLIEFEKSKKFHSHISNGETVSLKDAILCDDGSIIINNKKVYSLR